MVRRLVGALVQVATGRLSAADFATLLDPAAPLPAGADPARWTAPPSGLFLERVFYPGDPPPDRIAAATPVRSAFRGARRGSWQGAPPVAPLSPRR
jgi:tRNA U38,U39,U40 pseudouridine synthase TruA